MKDETLNMAIAKIEEYADIKTTIIAKEKKVNNAMVDYWIEFNICGTKVRRYLIVKEGIRNVYIHAIEKLKEKTNNLMVLTDFLIPAVKNELRDKNMEYMDAGGNIFLKEGNTFIYIDGKKAENRDKPKTNRAFTKIGLKVIFQLIIDDNLIQQPHRLIAERAGVAHGNIKHIFDGLDENNFLIKIDDKRFRLTDKDALVQKWIANYDEVLKPALFMGNFRFLNKDDFYNWETINLKEGETFWGGERAGEIYTKHLRPEIITIYTNENKQDLINNYKIVPDNKGNVKIYKTFWTKMDTLKHKAVHPLLAYADLMILGDKRAKETAEKIYNDYLKDRF